MQRQLRKRRHAQCFPFEANFLQTQFLITVTASCLLTVQEHERQSHDQQQQITVIASCLLTLQEHERQSHDQQQQPACAM